MVSQKWQTSELLELRNISLVYRALPALRNIHWRVTLGQQWACLGLNGAGKTSLAKIISRQAIHFSGELLRSSELEKGGIAYVCFEQGKTLCERDKKRDDSEFRADASDPGTTVQALILDGRDSNEAFHYWVKRLNMERFLHRGLRFISTGEMRKALLVTAILSQPNLLILDSPIDGLDLASQKEMQTVIDELLQSDLTVLMLCRQMEDVPMSVTHVIVLDNGEVLGCDTRERIFSDTDIQTRMHPPLPNFETLPPASLRPYSLPIGKPLLKLSNVAVHYDDLTVLHNVDWTLDLGTHCCISGPNGCGKTTLLSLITGDNHKAYGQDITLFGVKRGSGESVWDIKQKFGQLDTQLQLNFARGMRTIEVVVSGFFDTIGLYDEWGDTQRNTAEQWLCALGMADYLNESFDALSFGLQRMVLLARAMVKSPIILILDEPTLGLDGHHRKLMLLAIDHIAKNSDTQIIFVSHSVGETPACINQYLSFEPSDNGFELLQRRAETLTINT
ncbi:MAG: ATP-binding cassette domain-containing protein [Halioglobus sp.]|nr:ATP-binding cassette domain-containing protein [Halioglobus sp.]